MCRRVQAFFHKDGFGRSLFGALAGSAGLRIVGMGLGFLVGVQLARVLGPANYGLYGLAMSIISLITVPVEFGLPLLVTREVAVAYNKKDWIQINAIVYWVRKLILFLVVIEGAIISCIYFSGIFYINAEVLSILIIGLPLMPIVASTNLMGAAIRAVDQPVLGQLSELIVRPMVYCSFIFVSAIIFRGGVDAVFVMTLNVIAAILTLILTLFIWRSVVPKTTIKLVPREVGRKWIKSTLPMALTEGLRVGQGHAATLVIGWLVTNSAVGAYKVADAVALFCALPISLVNVVCAPLVARLFHYGDHERLRRLLYYTAVIMFFGVLLISMPFFVWGEYIIVLVFGDQYRSAANVLQILCMGHIASAAVGLGSTLMNMAGYEQKVTRALIMAILINITLAFILVPRFGALGAAIANTVGIFSWNLRLSQQAGKILKMNTTIFNR